MNIPPKNMISWAMNTHMPEAGRGLLLPQRVEVVLQPRVRARVRAGVRESRFRQLEPPCAGA